MSKIKVENLEKSYYIGDEEYKVLKDLSINFHDGELVAIYGESGSGKSTFMNVVGGLDFFQSGKIMIDNESIEEFTEKSANYYRNRKIGFIFQEFNLIENLSLIDNVLLPMNIAGASKKESKKRAKELLVKVGLGKFIRKKVKNLSGGQKQRVAIARSLANNPDIIFADEPTGALDSKTSVEILELLRSIASEGKCVIVITHSDKVSEYASRVVRLHDGIIIEDKVMNNLNVEKVEDSVNYSKKRRTLSLGKTLKIAYKNLMSKKFRTFLVAFGTSIGISGAILVTSLSDSAIRDVQESVSEITGDPTLVSVIVVNQQGEPAPSSYLTSEQGLDGVAKFVDNDKAKINVEYKLGDYVTVDYSNQEFVSIEYGKYPEEEFEVYFSGAMNDIGSLETLLGKDILTNKEDEEALGISSDNKDKTYKKYEKVIEDKIIGQEFEITINETVQKFKIVGSKQAEGYSNSGVNIDIQEALSLPYDTSSAFIDDNKLHLGAEPGVYVVNFDTVDEAKDFSEATGDTFVNPKDINGYLHITADISSILSFIESFLGYVKNIFFLLIGISLVVSVFMVALITYISTLERKTEIGVLRAIGASKNNITGIFVSEGVLIGVISFTISAIAVGAGIVGINAFLYYSSGSTGEFFTILPTFISILQIFVFVIFVMFLASIIPARNASKQNLIDVLREE